MLHLVPFLPRRKPALLLPGADPSAVERSITRESKMLPQVNAAGSRRDSDQSGAVTHPPAALQNTIGHTAEPFQRENEICSAMDHTTSLHHDVRVRVCRAITPGMSRLWRSAHARDKSQRGAAPNVRGELKRIPGQFVGWAAPQSDTPLKRNRAWRVYCLEFCHASLLT
jgi:hypothetical protein